MIHPVVSGAGWAIVSFGCLAAAATPEQAAAVKTMTPEQLAEFQRGMVQKLKKPAAIILSLLTFAFYGALYGLIARYWQSTILVFAATLMRGNIIFIRGLSLLDRVVIAVLCQIVVSYLCAHIASRLRLPPAKPAAVARS